MGSVISSNLPSQSREVFHKYKSRKPCGCVCTVLGENPAPSVGNQRPGDEAQKRGVP